jgi:hypothetical protein
VTRFRVHRASLTVTDVFEEVSGLNVLRARHTPKSVVEFDADTVRAIRLVEPIRQAPELVRNLEPQWSCALRAEPM